MRRVTALVLAVMFSISVVLPLVDSSAHRNSHNSTSRSHRGHRHSRQWWRRYRARHKRQRAALARRRVLAAQSGHQVQIALRISSVRSTNRASGRSRLTIRAALSLLMTDQENDDPHDNVQTKFVYTRNVTLGSFTFTVTPAR